jgi:hypothetical protein
VSLQLACTARKVASALMLCLYCLCWIEEIELSDQNRLSTEFEFFLIHSSSGGI